MDGQRVDFSEYLLVVVPALVLPLSMIALSLSATSSERTRNLEVDTPPIVQNVNLRPTAWDYDANGNVRYFPSGDGIYDLGHNSIESRVTE